jgi:hypothetical protein
MICGVNNNMSIKPNYLGIGEHKCGTTWLSECLRQHPDIFMSSPKELFFFGENYRRKGMDWYLGHFENAKEYKAIGEFSTSYLRKECAPRQILDSLGMVKIIVCIRNPVTRFFSHYKRLIRIGVLAKKEYSTLDTNSYEKAVQIDPKLLSMGNYSENLIRYFDKFGQENVYIALNDEMETTPEKLLHNLYSYLGVFSEFKPSILEKRISRGIIPKSLKLEKFRKWSWTFLRDYFPPAINLIKRLQLGDFYRNINEMDLVVEKNVWEILIKYYEGEIDRLEKYLDISLETWKSS